MGSGTTQRACKGRGRQRSAHQRLTQPRVRRSCTALRAVPLPPFRGGGEFSEGNLVVHVAARRAGPGRGRDLARRPRRAEFTAFIHVAAAGRRSSAAGAIQQRQFAAKVLQHHLGGIAVLARLILPFARLQRALDVNLGAFLQILLGDPAEILVEDDDAVPFGSFAPLAVSFHDSDVAIRRLATGRPSWVRRISGSAPRLPMRITLLTLPAMTYSQILYCRALQRLRSPLDGDTSVAPCACKDVAPTNGLPWPLSTRHTACTAFAGSIPQKCSYFVLGPLQAKRKGRPE